MGAAPLHLRPEGPLGPPPALLPCPGPLSRTQLPRSLPHRDPRICALIGLLGGTAASLPALLLPLEPPTTAKALVQTHTHTLSVFRTLTRSHTLSRWQGPGPRSFWGRRPSTLGRSGPLSIGTQGSLRDAGPQQAHVRCLAAVIVDDARFHLHLGVWWRFTRTTESHGSYAQPASGDRAGAVEEECSFCVPFIASPVAVSSLLLCPLSVLSLSLQLLRPYSSTLAQFVLEHQSLPLPNPIDTHPPVSYHK